ncbi:hypothetical protein OUZ56_012561 [Daphnia magna]|uniref:ISXO2-like transposase domain-containing protein n=1 Tax=Daphnia magna TaxID=35525 RepID=A0ABQ9Z3I4_9CRUS|nr:hypothetical protein OUZ56_012561 [Daphnia magna]
MEYEYEKRKFSLNVQQQNFEERKKSFCERLALFFSNGERRAPAGRFTDCYNFGREIAEDIENMIADRSATTLLEVIKDWIIAGSTIISDCWKAYDKLDLNFKDPESGVHTNQIEGLWNLAKKSFPSTNGNTLSETFKKELKMSTLVVQ